MHFMKTGKKMAIFAKIISKNSLYDMKEFFYRACREKINSRYRDQRDTFLTH